MGAASSLANLFGVTTRLAELLHVNLVSSLTEENLNRASFRLLRQAPAEFPGPILTALRMKSAVTLRPACISGGVVAVVETGPEPRTTAREVSLLRLPRVVIGNLTAFDERLARAQALIQEARPGPGPSARVVWRFGSVFAVERGVLWLDDAWAHVQSWLPFREVTGVAASTAGVVLREKGRENLVRVGVEEEIASAEVWLRSFWLIDSMYA